MKNTQNISTSKKPLSHTQKIWLTAIAILVAASIFLSIKMILNVPRDLGAQLEYVGSRETGCKGLEWVLFFGFCPRDNTQIYYYATDLTQDEIKKYFKNAFFKNYPSRGNVSGSNYSYKQMYFLHNNEDEFYINYYNETEEVMKTFHLKVTGKKYIISMYNDSYVLAKEAL